MKIDAITRSGKKTLLDSTRTTEIHVSVSFEEQTVELKFPVSSNPQGDEAERQEARRKILEFAQALAEAAGSLQ